MTTISTIHAYEVLDSRGLPTVGAAVVLNNGVIGEATVPSGASTVNNAAVAADTGLAVMAMCAAVTLILKALSGRILFLMATSAIIGIIE